jgi:hypothetical protein
MPHCAGALTDNGSMTFDRLLGDIECDLADLRDRGRIRAADHLCQVTGQLFHATVLPQYFTGDLTAPFVLVHLNPKQDRAASVADSYEGPVPSAKAHLDRLRHFGRLHYGPDSGRKWKSPFDHKQIRFLRPFRVIDFLPDDAPDARWINLERSIDQKLQLELIPYQSPEFSTRGMTPAVLEPHYQRLLDTILAAQRDYVIFCGRVFANLLRPWVTREHHFRLTKKDGTNTTTKYRFANLQINHNRGSIKAGLAHSYAMQGIPMSVYASECAARYHAN